MIFSLSKANFKFISLLSLDITSKTRLKSYNSEYVLLLVISYYIILDNGTAIALLKIFIYFYVKYRGLRLFNQLQVLMLFLI